MKERSLTSTWRSPCFRMGSHASSARCVESKTRKRSMSGITLKVFTSRVTSAIRVTIARKHSRAKMLCAHMCRGCTKTKNCDSIDDYLFRINWRNFFILVWRCFRLQQGSWACWSEILFLRFKIEKETESCLLQGEEGWLGFWLFGSLFLFV